MYAIGVKRFALVRKHCLRLSGFLAQLRCVYAFGIMAQAELAFMCPIFVELCSTPRQKLCLCNPQGTEFLDFLLLASYH